VEDPDFACGGVSVMGIRDCRRSILFGCAVVLVASFVSAPRSGEASKRAGSELSSPQIAGSTAPAGKPNNAGIGVIQHVVYIIKENRSFDNYFGTFPGADGATSGPISTGQVIPLGHTPDY